MDDFLIKFKEVDDFLNGVLGGGHFLINENQENIPLIFKNGHSISPLGTIGRIHYLFRGVHESRGS